MSIIRSTVGGIVLATTFLSLAGSSTGYGQNPSPAPRKFDSFEDLRTSDVKARLDLFAAELARDQNLRAFIVGYREGWLPGSFLREVHGYGDYLVTSRGLAPERLNVIDGGVAEQKLIELWLVPREASGPNVPRPSLQISAPMQFDRVSLGVGCVGEYTLELEEPRDSMKFFGAALRDNPAMKGFIVVNPSVSGSMAVARRLATSSKNLLINQHGIPADRIASRVDSRRLCLTINSWLAPAGLTVPKSSSAAAFFQSQLMAEAEQHHYAVRRIELAGNTYTRDNVIRRRLLQNEGDIFRRELLELSLRNISKLRNFRPVRLQDVEVDLNRKDKLIDFLIHLTERP